MKVKKMDEGTVKNKIREHGKKREEEDKGK